MECIKFDNKGKGTFSGKIVQTVELRLRVQGNNSWFFREDLRRRAKWEKKGVYEIECNNQSEKKKHRELSGTYTELTYAWLT